MEISNKALLALALVFLVISVISTGLALTQRDYRNIPQQVQPQKVVMSGPAAATGKVVSSFRVVGGENVRPSRTPTGNVAYGRLYRPPKYRR